MLSGPRARRTAPGSRTRLRTYRTMQATLTTSTKLRRRNSARSGPAKPHRPGLRRPHTRHTGASALVSRPHEGQRIAPDVLRNIVVGRRRLVGSFGRNAITLVEPAAEVDQAAGQRAERTMRIPLPRRARAAGGAGDVRHRGR